MPRRRSPNRPDAEGPDPIDIHVGARVRLRRTLMGLSQAALGQRLGMSFQQIQKYERGANRISASMMYALAGVLDIPISFFFDDLPDGQKHPPSAPEDHLMRRESLDMMRHYYRIPHDLRRQVYELVRAMARAGGA